MRILHVTPTYLPATRYGGPIYSVHGLAKAQARRGDEVQVFTTNVDGDVDSDVPLQQLVDLEGVRISYFPCGVGRRLYRSPKMGHALSGVVGSFDVVHVHSAFLWPPLAAARIARKAGTPYVFAPRGMLDGALIRTRSRFIKAAWIELFERRKVAEAAALHVTSEAERQGVLALGFKVKRIDVIPNGVELPTTEVGDTAGPPRILCLGRINWKKGLDRLIRAFAVTTVGELVIAGNDEEGLTPKLQALAQEFGVSHRVTFRGPAYGDEKWRLMRASTLFALASHSENFGNVVLEAMACGLPVVVTPGVGLAETVRRHDAGIVVEGEPQKFGQALAELLADPQRRRSMANSGRRLAEDCFSWRAVADSMDTLYRDVSLA